MKKVQIKLTSARLAVVARNIQDTASEIAKNAKLIEDATEFKLDLNQADKIVRLASSLYTLGLSERVRELSIKAKSIAEVLRDEVYEMPEALKRDEL